MLVVFVDDEPGVLHGIERMLLAQRVPWDVFCIPDPQEAIELIDRTPVDVVVADLKMPRIDGAELLRHVRERQPQAVRIVLSAANEPDLLRRAFDVAHGFLAKPCPAADLVAQVERGFDLRRMLDDAELRRIANDLGALPPAPSCWLELNRLMDDDRAEAAAVAKVVGRDPGLAAKVLQLCNSAYYSAGRPIADIQAAVVRLGFGTLREIVLLTEAYTRFNVDARVVARGQRESALASGLVPALGLDAPSTDVARTSALLAGIGDTLLARRSMPAAERETLGPALGAYLLALWNLPPSVVEAVALREAPARAGATLGAVGATHVATRLARGRSPDDDWLEAAGLAAAVPRWRAMLDRLAERGA
ncbi:MAG: HDOD domain-containing protein [Xanthomonadaceae bacterium]|jgi:HD-like signal output (HDOD) protein/ActR/RegA family two-component response regulator|nr:HDOD domain-containing protein [Xanthomonadaceae bacterium]